MDSDNNVPPWMEIFDGSAFHLDGRQPADDVCAGREVRPPRPLRPALLSFFGGSNGSPRRHPRGGFLPAGRVVSRVHRADGTRYTLEVQGRFGTAARRDTARSIDAAASCVWHYDRTPEEANPDCTNPSALGEGYPVLAGGRERPDWFMFGDPTITSTWAACCIDDVRLRSGSNQDRGRCRPASCDSNSAPERPQQLRFLGHRAFRIASRPPPRALGLPRRGPRTCPPAPRLPG